MKPSKQINEPELQRLQDWLAEYGLRVMGEEEYQKLRQDSRTLLDWKFRTYYLRRSVSDPVIGPPCPDRLLASRTAPAPLEPPPAPHQPRTVA